VLTASGKKVNGDFFASIVAAIAEHRFPERPDVNAVVA
jgi:hypothetical protein